MKNITSVALIGSLFLTSSVPTYARVTTITPDPAEMSANRSDTRLKPASSVIGNSATRPNNLAPGQARAMFAEKIKTRLDTRQQDIALKLVDRINTINTNQTDRLQASLKRLEAILAKIITRTDALEKQSVNVSTVQTAITTAQTAIATAQAAVTTQAAKEYTVTVTEDQPVGQSIRTTMAQLKTDWGTLRDSAMEPARQAVVAAFRALAALSPQPSVSTTPTL